MTVAIFRNRVTLHGSKGRDIHVGNRFIFVRAWASGRQGRIGATLRVIDPTIARDHAPFIECDFDCFEPENAEAEAVLVELALHPPTCDQFLDTRLTDGDEG